MNSNKRQIPDQIKLQLDCGPQCRRQEGFSTLDITGLLVALFLLSILTLLYRRVRSGRRR